METRPFFFFSTFAMRTRSIMKINKGGNLLWEL
uniref:Uncharacterized protein n=1 Tax=Siphoviridae sp. ctgBD49 TaxID=2826420 RepID=A0A8S5QNT5_9CAUD|nr:MAG TPA: hypothetical protein [Siphoviridae sp. ctgBD49]